MDKKRIVKMTLVVFLFSLIIVFVGAFAFKKDSPKGKTREERLSFISSFGWEVDKDSEHKDEILIPKEFGEVFSKYNEMQKSQGFDLSKFKGKNVLRYRLKILNHPREKDLAFINLLVYKGKIIGGEVFSPEINGFLEEFNTCYNKK